MPWITIVKCGCGQEHVIYWPSEELPVSPGPWYFECVVSGKTIEVRGLAGWEEVAVCPAGANTLRESR